MFGAVTCPHCHASYIVQPIMCGALLPTCTVCKKMGCPLEWNSNWASTITISGKEYRKSSGHWNERNEMDSCNTDLPLWEGGKENLTKKLQSVVEYNEQRRRKREEAEMRMRLTGVACPTCGQELTWELLSGFNVMGATSRRAECRSCRSFHDLEME